MQEKLAVVKFKNDFVKCRVNKIFLPKSCSVIVNNLGVIEFCKFEKILSGVEISNQELQEMRSVVRVATKEDVLKHEENCKKEVIAFEKAKELIKKCKLQMKLVSAEYSFDEANLTLFFVSENRVDFRELVKQLVAEFKTRIELRQIGAREEVSIVAGIGSCGRVCCCAGKCKVKDKVNIKMAKTQKLQLNPTKINGLCGKLKCCLAYEQKDYVEALATMPSVSSRVQTPEGKGVVKSVNVVLDEVSVKLDKDENIYKTSTFEAKDVKKC